MKLFEISNYLDQRVPLAFQEEYDNCGLLIGNKNLTINSVLVSLDCTEKVPWNHCCSWETTSILSCS